MFKKLIIFALVLSSTLTSVKGKVFNTESYETLETTNNVAGVPVKSFGLWIDGGSNVYDTENQAYSGSSSLAILKGNDASKPNYGSAFTKPINFSNSSAVSIDFQLLITNSAGTTDPAGYFAFEASIDGGENFQTIETYTVADLPIIKSPASQWLRDCKDDCGIAGLPNLVRACELGCITASETGLLDSQLRDYWDQYTISVPNSLLSTTTVFRFKSYLSNDDAVTKVYFDDVTINYEGGEPELSETSIVPTNDAPANNRSLYNSENFDASDVWGIWLDGGRQVYQTGYLAESGLGICMKNRYVEGALNEPGPNGEDTGEHKPTYSSIYLSNTDFTEVQSLQLEFSFVANGMEISDGDYFTLYISTNSGIDYEPVRTWTAGVDFLNFTRYNVVVSIAGDLTSTGKLTTTTMLKLQTWGKDDTDQVYIDNLKIYTVGNAESPKGTPVDFDWASFEQSVLEAGNGDVPTYDVINSKHIIPEYWDNRSFEGNNPETDSDDVKGKPGIYGAVEHTDCDHPEFGEHITQEYDSDLGKNVFVFHAHEAYDTDRCRTDFLYDDRQRVEIKTYSQSYEFQKGAQDETHFLSWYFKLPHGFDGSDKFTHLHQLKPKGGPHDGMPLITLTAVAGKVDSEETTEGTIEETSPPLLNLRYSPTDVSQVTMASIPLGELEGRWIQVLEKITFGVENEGRYEIIIAKRGQLNAPLLSFASYSLPMWKLDGDFIRPKWGIYRSIVQADKIKDEQVKFADIVILENDAPNAKYGDLIKFGEYVAGLPSQPPGTDYSWTLDLSASTSADTITLGPANTEGYTIKVLANGEETLLDGAESQNMLIKTGPGDDTVIVKHDTIYGALRLEGGAGKDILVGGSGIDKIYGGADDDLLIGGAGEDELYGQADNDTLIGGYDSDTLSDNQGSNLGLIDDADDIGQSVISTVSAITELAAASKSVYMDALNDHLGSIAAAHRIPTTSSIASNGNSFTLTSYYGINDKEINSPRSFSIGANAQTAMEQRIRDYLAFETDSAPRTAALDAINALIDSAPNTYARYVLWRLGEANVQQAKVIANKIKQKINNSSNNITSFHYVGDGLFTFAGPNYTGTDTWPATIAAVTNGGWLAELNDDLRLTELHEHSDLRTHTLAEGVEIDDHRSLEDIHPDLIGLDIAMSAEEEFDIDALDPSLNSHYFLSPSSYATDGFPAGHPAHGLEADVTVVAGYENAGTLREVNHGYSENSDGELVAGDSSEHTVTLSLYQMSHEEAVTHEHASGHFYAPVSRNLQIDPFTVAAIVVVAVVVPLILDHMATQEIEAKNNANLPPRYDTYEAITIDQPLDADLKDHQKLALFELSADNPRADVLVRTAAEGHLIKQYNAEHFDSVWLRRPSASNPDGYINTVEYNNEDYFMVRFDIKPEYDQAGLFFKMEAETPVYLTPESKGFTIKSRVETCPLNALEVATPSLLGFGNANRSYISLPFETTYMKKDYRWVLPIYSQTTKAKCLQSFPFVNFKIPALENTELGLEQVIFEEYLIGKYLVISSPTAPLDIYGWETLKEQDGTLVTINGEQVYRREVNYAYELVQSIPKGATIWSKGFVYTKGGY